MKTFGFVQVLLLLILLLAYQCSQAQDYAVTVRGDTINGKVRIYNMGPEKKIQVTTSEKKKVNVALPQVKTFRYEESFFRPVKGPNGYVFMKVLQDGFLSLYGYQLENQTSFDGLFLAKLDGTGVDVPNLGFRKVMRNYLGDCPEVAEKIQEGDLARRNLPELVIEYNRCLKSQQASTNARPTAPVPVAAKPDDEIKVAAGAWQELEDKVRDHADFASKNDALDMIIEIRNKLRRSEKVPNFLIEGLKSSLKDTSLTDDLEKALQELP